MLKISAKSRQAFPCFCPKNGFTLFEVILVIALFFIILSFAVPYGLRFFRVERLDSASRQLIEVLREAQSKALSQELDSDYGVFITEHSFILFKGASYATRDPQYDFAFEVSSHVEINAPDEITFQKLTGLPSAPAEIIIASGLRSNIIRINAQGMMSLDLNVSLGSY